MGFGRNLLLSIFTSGLYLVPAGALSAQETDKARETWLKCQNQDDAVSVAQQYAACYAVISKGLVGEAELPVAYFNRAQAQVALGRGRRAVADFSEAIRLNPSWAAAFVNRGAAYLGTGDHARAIADYSVAIRLNPLHAAAFNNRCVARAVAGQDLAQARSDCDTALGIIPGDANILDSRGLVGLKQERWQDAWNDYDEAVRTNPADASYLFGRGIAALRLGQTARGEADIAQAREIDRKVDAIFRDYGIIP